MYNKDVNKNHGRIGEMKNILITVLVSACTGFAGGWISHFFAKKIEDYRFSLLKKEQALKVAELFALWMKCDDEVLDKFSTEERRNHCEKLNKLTWELAIWIPDEKIVKSIMEKLSHSPEASKADIKEIILQSRELIQKRRSKILKWTDLVRFE